MNKSKVTWLIHSVILGCAVYILYFNSQALESKNNSLSDGVLGNKESKVTVIEYGDYQCPYCAQYHQTIEPQLINEYVKTGKIKLIFKNFQFLGPESIKAASAAECAREQGKFWPFHDALYRDKFIDFNTGGSEQNGFYNRVLFLKIANQVGLNAKKFVACYDSNRYGDIIQDETNAATFAGINATPAVVINNQLVNNPLSYDDIKAAIDAELKK